MKTKVTLSYLLCIFLSLGLFVSCSDSDNDPTPPSVTAPSGENSVLVGESVDLTFSVSTEAGYGSASVTATNGEASISSQPESGAPGGNIVVSYTGNTQGAGSVELSVTDADGQTDEATAVVSVGEESTTVQVNDNITSDQTWEDGKTYILGGRIAVEAGATLTIEGGAVIKGEAGQEANASVLIVARDATLNANGTADQPIIFTSVADEITPEMIDNGQFGSPNLSSGQQGLWGGVIILGNAPISASNEGGDITEVQIEGIPSSDTNGLYGGNAADDNSGTISYISIRHGGTLIGEGNEINGLTLGGVGSGTSISNVEVVANLDDGIEWFGGTVNVTNVHIWNNGDDALDTDQAWSGTVDNALLVTPQGSIMELDGPEGSFTSSGHTITNVTAFAGSETGFLIDTDANTDANVSNVLFSSLSLTDGGAGATPLDNNYGEYADNTNGYAITSLEAVLPADGALNDFFPSALINSNEVTSVSGIGAATVGADVSVFGWTWASQSGVLADLGL